MSITQVTLNSNFVFDEPGALTTLEKAQDFFFRAELSDRLQQIWDSIKHLPLDKALKIVKTVAIIVGVVLLSQNISITGILALAGSIAGLLFAAITNVLVWCIYIPLYAFRSSYFAHSVILALGLAWIGVSPIVALVFSPMLLIGIRFLEQSDLAKKKLDVVFSPVGEGIRKLAGYVAGFVGEAF